MPKAPGFKTMKAKRFLTLLCKQLGYEIVRQSGSHRQLKSPDHPPLTFAFHDGAEIGPARIRSILVNQVGLTVDEAKEVVGRG